MGKRNFQLKSDSNVVLNALADRQAMGALLYNGDAFFAAYGGDSGVEIPEGDFHIVKPKNSVVAVEIVAIDNEVVGEKLDKSYDVIKEVNFPITTGTQVIEDTLAYQNFDYVTYTPTNKELYDYVLANYFDLTLPVDKLAKEIFLIENIKKSQLENPISKMVKSNLFYTYSTYFKDNI
jgi:spermidine/putrescine-binding protein